MSFGELVIVEEASLLLIRSSLIFSYITLAVKHVKIAIFLPNSGLGVIFLD